MALTYGRDSLRSEIEKSFYFTSRSIRALPEPPSDVEVVALHDVVHAHFVEDEEENLSRAVKSQKVFIPLHPKYGKWNRDWINPSRSAD